MNVDVSSSAADCCPLAGLPLVLTFRSQEQQSSDALRGGALSDVLAGHGELEVVVLLTDPLVHHVEPHSSLPEAQSSWVASAAAGAVADGRWSNTVDQAGFWMLDHDWWGRVWAVLHIFNVSVPYTVIITSCNHVLACMNTGTCLDFKVLLCSVGTVGAVAGLPIGVVGGRVLDCTVSEDDTQVELATEWHAVQVLDVDC